MAESAARRRTGGRRVHPLPSGPSASSLAALRRCRRRAACAAWRPSARAADAVARNGGPALGSGVGRSPRCAHGARGRGSRRRDGGPRARGAAIDPRPRRRAMSDLRGRRWIVGAAARRARRRPRLRASCATSRFVSFDDPEYVAKNPHVAPRPVVAGRRGRSPRSLGELASAHVAVAHGRLVALFGAWAGGHHLTSVVTARGERRRPAAARARALTAHRGRARSRRRPSRSTRSRVESVAWVSERKDVLATLAWVLAMLAYARYVAHPSLARYAGGRRRSRSWVSLAKPSGRDAAGGAPPCSDAWPLGRLRARARARRPREDPALRPERGRRGGHRTSCSRARARVTSVAQLPIGLRLANALVAYRQLPRDDDLAGAARDDLSADAPGSPRRRWRRPP